MLSSVRMSLAQNDASLRKVIDEDRLQGNTNNQPYEEEEVSDLHDLSGKPGCSENVSNQSLKDQSLVEIKRDVFMRRRALDITETQDLKTHIQHRRNSIVQHVIGYNYDDHSTAGGLYTRVGIGSKIDRKIGSTHTHA